MDGDRITIRKLPPAAVTGGSARPANLIDHLRNDQIIWQFFMGAGKVTGVRAPRTKEGTPAYDIVAMFADPDVGDPDFDNGFRENFGNQAVPYKPIETPPGDIQRQLLNALADPRKFVAAHYLLCRMSDQGCEEALGDEQLKFGSGIDADKKSVMAEFDGLKVTCRTSWDEYDRLRGEWIEIDPQQKSTIQAIWHQRLGKPVASVSFQRLFLVASLFFLACWATFLKRRIAMTRRTRHGHCPTCGYDLRATPGRCPECGGVPAPFNVKS
jgi:hypothetical protein